MVQECVEENNVNDIDLTVVKKIAQTSANDSSNVLVDNAARSVNDVAIDLEEIFKNRRIQKIFS